MKMLFNRAKDYCKDIPFIGYYVAKRKAKKLVADKALNFPIWGEGSVKENINEAIHILSLHGVKNSTDEKISILMVRDYLFFGVTPKEFVLFDFLHKDFHQKATFLPDQLKDKLSMKYTGLEKFKSDLQDKYHFYELLSPFFKRHVMKLTAKTSLEAFQKFCCDEQTVFVKPLKASYGIGACMFEDKKESSLQLYERLMSNPANEYIVETFIQQDDEMAIFNSSSVNTVRIPSVLNNDGFHVIGAFMRTGRKGNIVDNGGSGGIFSAIDIGSGCIVTDGMDENGFVYSKHPDTGIIFKGFRIPKWDELLSIAEQAHRKMGGHKYIAWDFAYTKNGWVLIEGNWGQFLSQFVTGIGLKEKFVNMMED